MLSQEIKKYGYSDERHFQVAERLYRSWPSHYATIFIRAAVATGRLEAGLEAGRRASSFPAARGNRHIWYNRMGQALHQLGRFEEQLALSDTVRAQLPDNTTLINVMEYSARAGLGDVEGVKGALAAPEASGGSISPVGATVRAMDAGLELMAHGRQQEGEAMVAAALAELRKLREEQGMLDGRDWEARALVWTGQLICCHVPRTRLPPVTGTVREGPTNEAYVRVSVPVSPSPVVLVIGPLGIQPLHRVLHVGYEPGFVLYGRDGGSRPNDEYAGYAIADLGLRDDLLHPRGYVDDLVLGGGLEVDGPVRCRHELVP